MMDSSWKLICLLIYRLKPLKSKTAKNLLAWQFFLVRKVKLAGLTSSLQEVDTGNIYLEKHAIWDIHYSGQRLLRCPILRINPSYAISARSKSIFPMSSPHVKMLATSSVVKTASATVQCSNLMHFNSCKTNGSNNRLLKMKTRML